MVFQEVISDHVITREDILCRISEEEILQRVFGFLPRENQHICSPFREDRNPGCFFTRFRGRWYFKDFACQKHTWDCIDLLLHYYGVISLERLLECLSRELPIVKYPPRDYLPLESIPECSTRILFYPRSWQRRDSAYWKQYGISSANLEDDGVFPVERFLTLKGRESRGIQYVEEPCYAYTRFPQERVKLYFPRRRGKYRFISTCRKDDVGSVTSKGEFTILTKSYKDARVLGNLGYRAYWLQNESALPKREILERIAPHLILLDNDPAGVRFGESIHQHTGGIYPIGYIPCEYGVKDSSDFYREYGGKPLQQLINRMLHGEI